MNEGTSFAYLNLDLDWPGFTLVHVEKDAEGRLTLARVPLFIEDLGTELQDGEPGNGHLVSPAPAGIATTADCPCDWYIADPPNHRIWHFDACVGEPVALAYVRGPGSHPGQLLAPRGLAITHAVSGARLYVADSGNHRIQVIDLATQQPLAVWGQPDPSAPPAPSADPGRFNEPWALAADDAGNLYVVDHGNARIQKFTPWGQVDETLWETMILQPTRPLEPVYIAIAGPPGAERLYVLDRGSVPARVVVFDLTGASQAPGVWYIDDVPDPVVLAATAEAVYVGGVEGTIAKFSSTGQRLSSLGLGRPLAALALGCAGELLAGPGGLPISRLRLDAGYMPAGFFRAGPFQTIGRTLAWQRWRVLADPLALNAHIQLFTYTSTNAAEPPDAGGDNPFAAPGWVTQPRDELDVLILSEPVREVLKKGPPVDPTADKDEGLLETTYFWLGGVLRSDGTASPVLQQMRIDYAPTTSIQYLPALYREGAQRRLFLELLLAALHSELGRIEDILASLPGFFDPAATPSEWLPWLASWLDFQLLEDWPISDSRRHLATAVDLYSQRGTIEGLRRYLRLYTGVEARIEEPGAQDALFTLDETVALGFNTVLAPAHEQGAVLASTATLGQTHLLAAEHMGMPLFADSAHRFCVQVYASQLTEPQIHDRVIQVLEREKPAHTDYHLCVIAPRMRVGFQARIGVDSIVAGPTPDLRLGDPTALGVDTVLPNHPRRSRRVGHGVRVGTTL